MHTRTFLASTCGHTPRCTLWKNTANQCKPTQCALFCTVASVSHTPNPHDCMQAQPNLRKAVLTLSAAWNLFLQCAGCALQRRGDWWVERVCTVHTAHHPECTQAVPRRPFLVSCPITLPQGTHILPENCIHVSSN